MAQLKHETGATMAVGMRTRTIRTIQILVIALSLWLIWYGRHQRNTQLKRNQPVVVLPSCLPDDPDCEVVNGELHLYVRPSPRKGLI